MWFVALQPGQRQPCDCFEHLLVIRLSAWAEPLRKKNGAHVVKRGIRIVAAVGDTTKACSIKTN